MKKITFSLPAAALGEATEAVLLGDFNNWNLDKAIGLKVQADGTLAASIELEAGKSYQYKFLLNNGQWINDWAAHQYIHNADFGVENSVVFVAEEEVIVKETVAKIAAKPVKKAKKTVTAPKTKKVKAEKETPAAKDDLTKIEGIGPKIAKLLGGEGIKTFTDLGKATGKKLKTILEAAGPTFQIHDPASWPKQAKLAAAEKWEDLKALQDKLVAGK